MHLAEGARCTAAREVVADVLLGPGEDGWWAQGQVREAKRFTRE